MKYAKKSLGQNFLTDKNIIEKIVNLSSIYNQNIFEIGPGNGALTEEILKKNPKSLSVIEKDFDLAEKLKKKYLGNKIVKVFSGDILKFNIEKILNKNSVIFGNLPYNISSQILVKFLKFNHWPPKFKELIFMFQKELGEKIIGKFSTSNYGRISILSNYRLDIMNKFFVSPNCFFPRPKVTSMVIKFKPKKQKINLNLNNLEKITQIFFSNKRKMINKNIHRLLSKKNIDKISNLNVRLRPSDLQPEIYYKITKLYERD
tara:strand:+ start:3031 stop:3810 length:780 start_codon:yes stop_codon:yes gene_type:complete